MTSNVDALLAALARGAGIYDVSSGVRPGSIRDQIVRADMLVARLVARGEIDDRGRDLAVCGGGVAGVAAAVAAARKSVGVTLYERDVVLFGRQRSSSRWISPYFYEWPMPEFTHRDFPSWGKSSLTYSEGLSSAAARGWDRVRKAARGAGGAFNLEAPVEVVDIAPDPGNATVDVVFRKAGQTRSQRVGALIVAVAERPRPAVGFFAGADYWCSETPASAIATSRASRVAISGGGDGALQDLVAIATTRDDARSVFDEVRDANRVAFDAATEAAHKVENQWRRATALGSAATDCPEHQALDRWCSQVANALWADASIRERVLSLCAASPTITLVHTCNHFCPLYGVNRLLASVVSCALREMNRLVVHEGRRTTQVLPVASDHICDPSDPVACMGHQHELFAANQLLCGHPRGRPEQSMGQFDLVLAHHFEAEPRVVDPLPARLFAARQLLPLHLSQA